jgi:PAS domain S-box-containing protein
MTDTALSGDELIAAIVTSSNDAIVSVTLDGIITSWNPAAERLFGYTASEAIGQSNAILLPQGDKYGFNFPITLITRSDHVAPYHTRRGHKDGRVLDLMLTLWAMRDRGGRVTGVAGLFRPLEATTSQSSSEQIESHRLVEHRLQALTRVLASLTFDQPMEATLDTLAAGVVEVTRATACAVALIDEEQLVYRVAGTCGLPDGYAAAVEQAYRSGANLSSLEAYRTLRPIHRTASDYIQQDPRQTQVARLVQNEAWDVIVSVPLVIRNRALGAMTCCYPIGVEPDEQEIALLMFMADQAAVAVQTAQLFAELQGKAALEERQRLARELHDSVSQALFGIGLGARTARTLLDRDPAKAAEPLDFVITLAEAGLTEMRALIFELRPDALETEGLVRLLEQQSAALRSRHGLAVATAFGPEPEASMPIKEMLYRIAQEALHNTTKHARAQNVTLSLRQDAEGIVLEVTDDGVGFDPSALFPGHLGLRSMRERANRHGGAIEIWSAPGGGTRTRVFTPTPSS